jgi:hypothetical protein
MPQSTTLLFPFVFDLGIHNRLRDLDNGECNHDDNLTDVFVDEVHLLLLLNRQVYADSRLPWF